MAKKISNLLMVLVLFVVCGAFVSANMYISDQGTGVIDKSTGLPLSSADLTVQIWDDPTGGNALYSYNFVGVVNNGSWNLIIGEIPGPILNLSYGQVYYKDYLINGEDATFKDNSGASVARLKFTSPSGQISSAFISESDPLFAAWNYDYGDLLNEPTDLGSFTNNPGYIALLGCNAGEVPQYNGVSWGCAVVNGTGSPGESVTINSIDNNGDGTYTWRFSDGYNFTTSNLVGPQGTQGIQGLQGLPGANGINGSDGAPGTPGLNGVDGVNGSDGADGYTPVYGVDYVNGSQGPQGEQGIQGIQGPAGINGTNGIDGLNGTDGADGTSVTINSVTDNLDGTFTWHFSDGYNFTTSNLTGAQGIQGEQGLAGVDGINGTNGINGINGTNGIDGVNGSDGYTPVYGADYVNGTNGIDGANGTNGIDGVNGSDGYTPIYGVDYVNGSQGPQGEQGIPGINGTNGIDGVNGTSVVIDSITDNLDGTFVWRFSTGFNFTTSNLTGPQGEQGIQGIAGINGTNGVDGVNGTNGINGVDGVNGTNGIDGVNGTSVYMSSIDNNLDGTYTWRFTDGFNFTTANLTGPQGIQGIPGIDGVNGTDGIFTGGEINSTINYTNTGVIAVFANGCSQIANETGIYFVC